MGDGDFAGYSSLLDGPVKSSGSPVGGGSRNTPPRQHLAVGGAGAAGLAVGGGGGRLDLSQSMDLSNFRPWNGAKAASTGNAPTLRPSTAPMRGRGAACIVPGQVCPSPVPLSLPIPSFRPSCFESWSGALLRSYSPMVLWRSTLQIGMQREYAHT